MNISVQTIRDMVKAKVGPLAARVAGLVTRGELKTLKDSTGLQRAQVSLTADEVQDDVEVITPPGFTSRPAAGAEVLVLAVGGNSAHRVALVFDRGTRLVDELAEGEAAMHIGNAGQVVHLKANGDVVITPGAGAKVLLGDDAATKHAALAEMITARLDALVTAINAWVPAPMDGGAALKAALAAWLGGSNACASDNVYAKG